MCWIAEIIFHQKNHKQKKNIHFQIVKYPQVFEEKTGFIPNLSVLDLIFCVGPQAGFVLEQMGQRQEMG